MTSMLMKRVLCIAFACLCGDVLAGSFPDQPYTLLPQPAEGGVVFQCYAPDAHVVYLAGDFNGWA